MDPTTVELFFTNTECETSGFGVSNAARSTENLDAEAAIKRTQAILAWLASRNMIDLLLGNLFTYKPDPRSCDLTGTGLICADRLWLRDNPDGRWLLYDTTPQGRLMLENRWAVFWETERGSTS